MKPFQQNQSLSELSTFGIGGYARYFTIVTSISELQEILLFCSHQKIQFHVVGKGSNSLFDDRGFDGLVILNKIDFCSIEGTKVDVGSGFSFSHLGRKTAKMGLSGLEFASGIPASVGGAIFMNAGANGGEASQTVTEVQFIDPAGELHLFKRKDLDFSYRYSNFQKMKGVIASAIFDLIVSSKARQTQLEIISYRMQTQPCKDKSCGCVFRNPPNAKAGALIESCGLKGKKIGDAAISDLHANFIVNKGNAKAKDVLELARFVKECVKQQTGIELEMELRVIGNQ